MALLRVGRNRIAGLITGAETCHWGTSGASIWVSSSTEAHTAVSSWFTTGATTGAVPVGATGEATFPLTALNIFQHRGVFSTAQANFQWESWLINTATASGAGVPLNLATAQALGTKANTQSWQITTCVTLTT